MARWTRRAAVWPSERAEREWSRERPRRHLLDLPRRGRGAGPRGGQADAQLPRRSARARHHPRLARAGLGGPLQSHRGAIQKAIRCSNFELPRRVAYRTRRDERLMVRSAPKLSVAAFATEPAASPCRDARDKYLVSNREGLHSGALTWGASSPTTRSRRWEASRS